MNYKMLLVMMLCAGSIQADDIDYWENPQGTKSRLIITQQEGANLTKIIITRIQRGNVGRYVGTEYHGSQLNPETTWWQPKEIATQQAEKIMLQHTKKLNEGRSKQPTLILACKQGKQKE